MPPIRGARQSGILAAIVCGCLLLSCSTPTVPELDDNTPQKYIDELEWFELGGLQQVEGLPVENAWIAAALDEQLIGRRLLLPFTDGQLASGVADIQLRFDEVPLPASWSSPPGEIVLQSGMGSLEHVIHYSPDPNLPDYLQQVDVVSLHGRFSADHAESLLRQAVSLRSSQPVIQNNPETHERWLLGRSLSALDVQWEFEGQLGGVPFSFTASQQLVAVSSYYELSILSGQDARATATQLRQAHLRLFGQ